MKRKVIQLARRTHVISLPPQWLQQFEVKKGDELDVQVQGSSLLVSTGGRAVRSTTVDVSGLSHRALLWTVSSLYKKGYDGIDVYFDSPKVIPEIQRLVQDSFIGFAITQQRQHMVALKAIAKEDPAEFGTTLHRAFHVTISFGEAIIDHLQQGQSIQELTQLEKTNNQLTNFCERVVNKGFLTPEKSAFQYTIAWNLEKVADEYKYLCKKTTTVDRKTIEFFREVNTILREYYALLTKLDPNRLSGASDRIRELWEYGYTLLDRDAICIHHLLNALSAIADFSTALIAVDGQK